MNRVVVCVMLATLVGCSDASESNAGTAQDIQADLTFDGSVLDTGGLDVPEPDATPDTQTEGGFTLESLQIGAIDVSDAAISWRDETTGADYRLTGVRLGTGQGPPV